MTDAEINEAIKDLVAGPKKHSVDGIATEEHSIQDLLALKKQLASDVVENPWGSLRMARVVPPGAT